MYDYGKLYNHIMGGRSKQDRTIANNTIARFEDDSIVVRLHSTDVAKFYPDGTVILNSGGWKTNTTKERLNQFIPAPFSIWQESGVWYIHNYQNREETYIYQDGVTFTPSDSGYVVNNAATKEDEKAIKALRKQIKRYTEQFMNELIAGNIPAPDSGDCWYCAMRSESGNTLGEETNNTDHLLSHFEEEYYVPSLFWRAVETFGLSSYAKWALSQIWGNGKDLHRNETDLLKEQGKSSLQKYLLRQFQLG